MADKQPLTDDLAREIVRQNVEHHDSSASLYDISHPNMTHWYERRLLGQDLALLEELLADRETVRAVDTGAGTGRLTLEFARRGWEVTAVDNSREMLRIAHNNYQRLPKETRGDLKLVHHSAEEFLAEAEGEFDLFAFSSVLHHLPHWLEVLRLCASRLSVGGCIFSTQDPLPVEVEGRPPGMMMVRLLDDIVRTPQRIRRLMYRLTRGRRNPRGGALVDYHVPQGLDFGAMEAALAELGVERRRFVRYQDRGTGLVAYLDDHLFRTPNWYFRYIGQRTG